MNLREHVVYALRNAEIRSYPFPHFHTKNVFPESFYNELIKRLGNVESKDFAPMGGAYEARTFGPDINEVAPDLGFMSENEFMNDVMKIFLPWYKKRYGNKDCNVATDLRLVRDHMGYQIGPHTDARWKLISLLFYLPHGWAYREFGTGIYMPSNKKFRCEGGPHYDFDGFKEAWRAPYEPNTCFGFWKTDNSFHGVQPITREFNRDVLLYNVYDTDKIPNRDMIHGETSVGESNHVAVRSEGAGGSST